VGDINGIGTEIIIKTLSDHRILENCTPIIYGSAKLISFYKKFMPEIDFNYQTIKSADSAIPKKINIINCWQEEINIQPGEANQDGGLYAFKSLEAATTDLASTKIDVLLTAPISKENIQKAGFKFPGHTEYLADLSGGAEPLMMMVAGDLKVALVTTHIPLSEVSKNLSKEKILQKIQLFNQSLKKDFVQVRPKIAVLGLNPHAGENGKIGTEEIEIILPAIQQARENNITVMGPYPADGFFGSGLFKQFDGILAMYHDQGLAPFKALSFDSGVNYTAGLPIVRTSPDHGTAFDISGQNCATENSFRNALYLAIDVFDNRSFVKEINANPLQKQTEEK
jgi:4-hydroxythreonine-4-phosphate dehydrogenase